MRVTVPVGRTPPRTVVDWADQLEGYLAIMTMTIGSHLGDLVIVAIEAVEVGVDVARPEETAGTKVAMEEMTRTTASVVEVEGEAKVQVVIERTVPGGAGFGR